MTLHYHVTQHTPGYSPWSDEPDISLSVEDAKAEIAAIVEGWREDRAELEGETETINIDEDGTGAYIYDRSEYSYDLGIAATITECDEAECEAALAEMLN